MLARLDQALGRAQSYGINQGDVLLFRYGIEGSRGHRERILASEVARGRHFSEILTFRPLS